MGGVGTLGGCKMSPYASFSAREPGPHGQGSWRWGWGWGFCGPPDELAWRYVGEGKGHYMIVSDYHPVEGRRDSALEVVAAPARLRPSVSLVCCFGVVSALFFIALVWWKASGALPGWRPASQLTFGGQRLDGASPCEAHRHRRGCAEYNCFHGQATWQEDWTARKKAWCCLHSGVGCAAKGSTSAATTTTTSAAFDCRAKAGFDGAGWPASKKAWCCDHHHVACAPYNCSVGPLGVRAWPEDQKAWCCIHEKLGCPADPIDFDCSVGLQLRSHWSKGKKDWCCHHYHRGCDYDCRASLNWQSEWSNNKKAWCCQHKGKGCPGFVAPRFDCGDGADQGWHQEKKDWCCKHEHAGCASHESYDCSHGFENWRHAWDDEKKSYCCRHHRRGCEHDCSGIENWKSDWSSSQKTWCCNHVGVGCER
eukprot:s982_g9.t1